MAPDQDHQLHASGTASESHEAGSPKTLKWPKAAPGWLKLDKFVSLRLELVVMSMLLVLVMSGTMGMTVAGIFSLSLNESRINTAKASARGAALALSAAEGWSGFPWENLEFVLNQSGFELIIAADVKGRALRRASGAVTGRDEVAIRAVVASGLEEVVIDGDRLSVVVPVVWQGRVVGAVCVAGSLASASHLKETVRFWMLAALGLNIVLMGLYTVFILNRRLVAPLKELAGDLEDLGRNRFTPRPRAQVSTEIGKIFAAFDQAASELMESRRRLEDQLKTINETKDHLVASEKMAAVGRLASGLAHELGNPIGALTGFVHLLRLDDLDDDDKRMVLDQSAHELERMDSSIKELLSFSRPAKRVAEPVEAMAVANAALGLARPQKWCEGLELKLESSIDHPVVLAERNSLLQVLLNLLANAGHALENHAGNPGISIDVAEAEKSGYIQLRVTDNGPGVDPADVPHLFEPYFSRKAPGKGTGLGLAISLSIVNGFGGRLEYAPAESGGACFIITLPAAPREED